jgi:hypothetical protein
MRSLLLKTSYTAALLIAVAVLSGCFLIVSESGTQFDLIGDVEITTQTCLNSGAPCSAVSGNDPSGGGPFDNTSLLIAFRLPDGVVAPETLVPNPPFSFTLDKTYSDSLTQVAPPPAGQRWVGYRSQPFMAPISGLKFKTRFRLPQGADGSPFKNPFSYRTVTGSFKDPSGTGGPVRCASDPTIAYVDPVRNTRSFCIDSPVKANPTDKPWVPDTTSIPTRDLGVTGGGTVNIPQGGDADVPFSVDLSGAADPGVVAQITTENNLKDVFVTQSGNSITPATDSKNPLNVHVHVDPTNAPGTYALTMIARLPNGQERRRTAKIVVVLGRPVVLSLPDVTGTLAVGQTVACPTGDWTGNPSAYAYQWTSNGADIPGATSATYKLTQDEGAKFLACRVAASNATDKGDATSRAYRVAQVGGADVNTTAPASLSLAGEQYSLDTGIVIGCPANLAKNCGVGALATTLAEATIAGARKSATQRVQVVIAKVGMSVKSGQKAKVVLHLTRAGAKLLDRKKKLRLLVDVTTRSHSLERVESRKSVTVHSKR